MATDNCRVFLWFAERGEVKSLWWVKGDVAEWGPKETQWIYGLQQQIVCGDWTLTMCQFGRHLTSIDGRWWETPTILLGRPRQLSLDGHILGKSLHVMFSPSARVLMPTTGALSRSHSLLFWPGDRADEYSPPSDHLPLRKKNKIGFSSHSTAQEIGSVIGGGLSSSGIWKREHHLRLIILRLLLTRVLSEQELSFTGSVIILYNRVWHPVLFPSGLCRIQKSTPDKSVINFKQPLL